MAPRTKLSPLPLTPKQAETKRKLHIRAETDIDPAVASQASSIVAQHDQHFSKATKQWRSDPVSFAVAQRVENLLRAAGWCASSDIDEISAVGETMWRVYSCMP
jgi:hypothetical protein